jgi:uncharacterized small protein (DUF1192 family)
MQEDDKPRPRPAFQPGQNLDSMSVEELQSTIEMLREEIGRLESVARAKAEHLSVADALFAPKK